MVKNSEKEKLHDEIRDLKARLVRALADYDNLQKRTVAEKDQIIRRANLNLLAEMLPWYDLLKKAQENVADPALELVRKEFEGLLEKTGVETIDQEGVVFDPKIHEVVEAVSGGKDNQVAEVVHAGYKMGDVVIRPAIVKVYSHKENDKS